MLLLIFLAISILFCGLSFVLRPAHWKTQTILYTHGHFSQYSIEFQMQDVGAVGYNRRTVIRIKILPAINSIYPVSDISKITGPWLKAGFDVNELGLKGG